MLQSRARFAVIAVILVGMMVACRTEPEPEPVPTPTLPPPIIASSDDEETTETTQETATSEPVSPESSLIPEGRVGPDNYPDDVNPLTGLIVTDLSVLDRRPMAIKVANTVQVRPQAGLAWADLVYEHYAEGGLTRLTAIYYGQAPTHVGSVRSGRLIDIEMALMYDAIIVSAGYSHGVTQIMRDEPWRQRNISIPFGYYEPYLFRIEDATHFEPHNLYANLEEIWNLAVESGFDQVPDLTPGMTFEQAVPEGGTSASEIHLQYLGSNVRWLYNEETGLYVREQDGEPHTDELTGEQLTAANVIVVRAEHVPTDIVEDELGNLSVEIQIWGEGEASIFRDGQRFDGIWQRTNPDIMLTFTDISGNFIPLKPGNTWFQIIPLTFNGFTVEP
jgi:hypothetical protein